MEHFLRNLVRRYAWRAGLALITVLPAFGQVPKSKQPVVLDRIVAIVNDEAITARELDQRAQVALKQMAQQGAPTPAQPIVEKQVLERMIGDRVQLQFAKES